MNKITMMLVVLGIIGLQFASSDMAAANEPNAVKAETDAVPAKDKTAGKTGAGEKKSGKAGADKTPMKVSTNILKEQLDGIKKQYPKLTALRQQVDDASTDLRNLKEISGEKERRKAERQIPKAEEKLDSLLQKLAKEYEKVAAPYDAEWTKLKEQNGKLKERIAELEAKNKKTDKLYVEWEQITNRITQLDTIRSGLAAIAIVEPDK